MKTPCWEWPGYCDQDGYGQTVRDIGFGRRAHRVAYEAFVGPIQAETLDHLCRNRACVNPEHLAPASHRTNLRRGIGFTAQRAAQTHCIHGHEFTVENTRIRSNGTRQCRACARERARAHRAK